MYPALLEYTIDLSLDFPPKTGPSKKEKQGFQSYPKTLTQNNHHSHFSLLTIDDPSKIPVNPIALNALILFFFTEYCIPSVFTS